MNITEAKNKVIEAGIELVKKGLIARTWGNVSCRINADQFVITPSGRAYETLIPDEIVPVNIEDCSYEGNVEPSSEKGVHAEVYRQRDDINFVIHTHQPYASALSPLKIDIDVRDRAAAALIGRRIFSIPYGLSGTKKLRENVAAILSKTAGKAYLMASHGALCLGEDCDEAFNVAAALEEVSADFINRRYQKVSGSDLIDPLEFSDYVVSLYSGYKKASVKISLQQPGNSERTDKGFKLHLNSTETDPFPQGGKNVIEVKLNNNMAETGNKSLPPAALIHRDIYLKYNSINAVIHSTAFDTLTISRIGNKIYPMLDDFAQIIGVNVLTANDFTADDPAGTAVEIAKKLKNRHAVLLKNNGALCCGPTKSDAAAAVMILDKNCKAVIASSIFGRGKPINPIECRLMRHGYLRRYSRKIALK